MGEIQINEEIIKKKLNKASNFKTPGPDNINNFWLKQLTSLHRVLTLITGKEKKTRLTHRGVYIPNPKKHRHQTAQQI